MTAATNAHAQQAPPPPAPAPAQQPRPAAAEDEEIVVLAPATDEVRIDRRTYLIRNDPIAQATNMLDMLGRIPSVSVAPSGTITLLGAQGVSVQVNGQTVPGASLDQILRGMQGSEVERIEVITNPGAQNSAQASGGIINIITRQTFSSGLTGSVNVSGDNIGSYQTGLNPTWSRGAWTLTGRLNLNTGDNPGDFERERETFSTGAITTERGSSAVDQRGWNSGLQAIYRPNQRDRTSLSLDSASNEVEVLQLTDRFGSAGLLSNQVQNFDNAFDFRRLTFDFQRRARPQERLWFNLALSENSNSNGGLVTLTPTSAPVSQFRTFFSNETRGLNSRLDLERPLSNQRFLTLGTAFDMSEQTSETNRQTLIGTPLPSDGLRVLDGKQQTFAAFVMYQFPTGDWTWQPGVRAENYRREVISSGAETDGNDLRFFPSIHIRRELTPDIDLDLSYTSRIQRPPIELLDPAVRFFDATRASSGNPNLRPTTIDAYEANLVHQEGGKIFSATLFDRINDDITSQAITLVGGVTFTMPVNAGSSEQRGLALNLRGPITEGWRYSLNADFLNRSFDALNSSGTLSRRSEFEYSGSAQLEYRDRNQSEVGADNLQFDVRFQGPRHELQTERDAFITAHFSWRRRLTERVFAFVQVQDIFDSGTSESSVTTPDYFERSENRGAGTRVRLSLTYQFGAGAEDRQPNAPDSGGGPGAPPGQ